MNLVQKNPYRTIGILVGATAREQSGQVNRLKQFIEADQIPPEDFSFPQLGTLYRTIDDVTEAASKLNLDSDKMNAALFWFYKGNAISDEPAFDALKEGDFEKALDTWQKRATVEITQRNASAYSNLATLYISGVFNRANANGEFLEQGISLKLKFLESDFIKDIKSFATDETFRITKKELQLSFLNQLQAALEKDRIITSNKFLALVTEQDFSAKEDFLKAFVQKPIEQIEKKIEESKSKRKANKADAIKAANTLLAADTKELVNQLKSILGTSAIRYSSIADKLALELFACGRDYFTHFKETSTDPSEASMKLFEIAKSYAVGNIVKQQIEENIQNLEEWINDKPEREKQIKIKADFDALMAIFQEFENARKIIRAANLLINRCKPILDNIKAVLGSSDSLYLKLSTRVVGQSQSYIVGEVNKAQENFEYKIRVDRYGTYGTIENLKTTFKNAWAATLLVGTLDMEDDFKTNQYYPNKESLKGLCAQLGVSTPSYSPPPSRPLSTHTSTPSSLSLPPPSRSSGVPLSIPPLPRRSLIPPKVKEKFFWLEYGVDLIILLAVLFVAIGVPSVIWGWTGGIIAVVAVVAVVVISSAIWGLASGIIVTVAVVVVGIPSAIWGWTGGIIAVIITIVVLVLLGLANSKDYGK